MDTVEDIEFPFTAPPTVMNNEKYIEDKRKMITTLVEENKYLNKVQKQKLIRLLYKYEECFSMKGENLKQTDATVHEIDTGNTPPFRERLRPYSPPIQAVIDKEVERMVKLGVLVPSRSPYASNLLLVSKPDSSEPTGKKDRVCASFVHLNKLTRRDSYPLPNIQLIFDSIGHSRWFTTMDLLSGFWQIMIKPEHRHKTAVITSRGLYEFVVMAFGLCNAPATFQRLMDAIVLPEYRDFIQTYIDDVLTHSMTFDDHLQHIEKTLTLFKKNKLMVKLSKCKFAHTEVKFYRSYY
jgi:predicted nucleotidyltransferase